MTANDTLIQSMLKCDGTNKNCKGCVFAENPECRNAMAHHGGALIQLQDVVVQNLSVQMAAVREKLASYVVRCDAKDKLIERQDEIINAMTLWIQKHHACEVCDHRCDKEYCGKCRDQSEWEMDMAGMLKTYRDTVALDPDDECDDDDDGLTEL